MPRLPTSIDDLKPAPYNPRRIKGESADGLRESLMRYGDLGGIVWNATTGHLVAGHQRLEQLKRLGARLVSDGEMAMLVAASREFPIRIVELDDAEEQAANLTANNPFIAGHFTRDVSKIVDELDAHLEDAIKSLRLDQLRDDREPREKKQAELREWDGQALQIKATLSVTAELNVLDEIRQLLTEHFPEADLGVSIDQP